MPKAPTKKHVQYFDNNGSRAIYQDGWVAATFGPLVPWLPGRARPRRVGFGQGQVGALQHHDGLLRGRSISPRRTRSVSRNCRRPSMRRPGPTRSIRWARASGCACIPRTASRRPTRAGSSTRRRRGCRNSPRPGIGRANNTVTIDAEFGDNASGVLYALGGAGGGLALYMDKGQLVYEYNMMIIERYVARSASKIPAGKHRIEVTTTLASAQPLSPADVVLKVDGQGSGAHDGEAHRARGVLRQRDLRRRRRPRFAGVARLLRSQALQVRRQDRESRRQAAMTGLESTRNIHRTTH